ncbi:outer membrane lipoprotein LolB [Pseudoduganella flava]|uniref:Outer-membrane lipoprotein LolB n=1 Tax=Pseudoduganella flava TaxID=871742 RepID=A0A562PLX3_9BURK|nr:outer membrane lipoprotein LolB [Pseudoduganella flava]QGZ40861.1 outer membrane lipoprotein LolB [Pseudoduganella flava]TWI45465.1 outer membrane lipoprotein LolB [Pseudoduganella flava]
MTATRLIASAALAAAFLSGCATAPRTPLSTTAVAPYVDKLELAGNLSVNYVRDGKRETLSGKFTWRQDGSRTDVELASPLGQTIATIAVTPGEAVLTEGNKPPVSAPDVDALTARVLGWPLPVAGLRDWLQGYAMAESGQRFAASPARNQLTTRDGWQLEFVAWQDDATPPKPRRIDARRGAGGDVENIEIRIVVLERTDR